MAQLDKMLKLLKQIDSVEIPPNDFDTAWDHKVEVLRNHQTNPIRPAIPVPPKAQDATRTTSKTDSAALEISLTSSAEKSAAEQEEEAKRKAAVEKQNALPVWHTHSTVNANNAGTTTVKNEAGVPIKQDVDEDQKPSLDELDDKVAAYYAEMEREKALQAQEDASSADEDDSDDFDEFEDVNVSGQSGPGTPATGPAPTSVPTPSSGVAGIKREHDTGSSAAPSSVGTPSTPADDGPAMKKVKTEPGVKEETSTSTSIKPDPEVKQEPDVKDVKKEEESDEDDDEEEFEDV